MNDTETTLKKDDPKFVLLSAEYDGCRQRYEDIYKAIWTQFNYFIIAVGALLAFGKDNFGTELPVILACVPLLFWYWATFEPLNRYADGSAERAKDIELHFNKTLFVHTQDDYAQQLRKVLELNDPDEFSEATAQLQGMWHFSRFCKRRERARLSGARGEAWSKDCKCRKNTSKVCLLFGVICAFISTGTIGEFRLPASNGEYPNVDRFFWGLFAKVCPVWLVIIGFSTSCLFCCAMLFGIYRERIRVGVRTFVRLAAAALHLVTFISLVIYVSKVAFSVPTGPTESRYEVEITEKDGKLYLEGPKKIIEQVKTK